MKTGLKSIGMVVNVDGNFVFDKPWLETGSVCLSLVSPPKRLQKRWFAKKYVLLVFSPDVVSFVIKSPKCCLNKAINRINSNEKHSRVVFLAS